MALRQIILYGHPILRKKSKEVTILNDRIRDLLDDMAETMYRSRVGGGLAACQIGYSLRLIVIDMGQGLLKLVNPRIIASSGSQEVVEGCLSVPDKRGRLIRPLKVTVRAYNEYGQEIVIHGEGALAKCLCHEIDHLNGILFIDRAWEFNTP